MAKKPTPTTEQSQIVINWTAGPTLILRFSSVRHGENEFRELNKAWAKFITSITVGGKPVPQLHYLNGDMFVSMIDLAAVTHVSFVDHAIREAFTPV